jgi:hypothetical protein
MVGFSEDLKAATKSTECSVALLRGEMGGDDLASFDAAIGNVEGVPANAIDRAVRRGEYETVVGNHSLRRHRRQECTCFEVTS